MLTRELGFLSLALYPSSRGVLDWFPYPYTGNNTQFSKADPCPIGLKSEAITAAEAEQGLETLELSPESCQTFNHSLYYMKSRQGRKDRRVSGSSLLWGEQALNCCGRLALGHNFHSDLSG